MKWVNLVNSSTFSASAHWISYCEKTKNEEKKKLLHTVSLTADGFIKLLQRFSLSYLQLANDRTWKDTLTHWGVPSVRYSHLSDNTMWELERTENYKKVKFNRQHK